MPEREAMSTEQRLSEIKPCPFCGGEAKLRTSRCAEDAMMATVECTQCLIGTTVYEDAYAPSAEAIAAWNTRSDATLRASEARAEESEKAHEADTVAAAELIDLLHTRVATAEADAKALRQRLGEIARLYGGPPKEGDREELLERIAALAAIQDESPAPNQQKDETR